MLGCVRYSLGNYPPFHPLVVYPRYPTLTLVSLEQEQFQPEQVILSKQGIPRGNEYTRVYTSVYTRVYYSVHACTQHRPSKEHERRAATRGYRTVGMRGEREWKRLLGGAWGGEDLGPTLVHSP